MAPSVLAQGPVLCGVCGEPFSVGKTVSVARESLAEQQREPDPAPTAQPDRLGQRRDREGRVEPAADIRAADWFSDPDRHALTATQRAGLAALIELSATRHGVLLLTDAGAWYAARRSGDDTPLLGASDTEVDAANRAARAMLKLDGTLHGPAVDVGGNELQVGELVRIGASDPEGVDAERSELPPAGVFGTVEHTDRVRGEITIDFAISGRRTIAVSSQAAASLTYGYAEYGASCDAGLVDLRRRHERTEPEHLAPDIAFAP